MKEEKSHSWDFEPMKVSNPKISAFPSNTTTVHTHPFMHGTSPCLKTFFCPGFNASWDSNPKPTIELTLTEIPTLRTHLQINVDRGDRKLAGDVQSV